MSEVLTMAGKNVGVGEFVKTLVSPNGEVGFADGWNVHKAWLKKTISFDQAFEKMERELTLRKDLNVTADKIKAVTVEGKFKFEIDGEVYGADDWSLSSLSARSPMKDYSSSVLSKMLAHDGDSHHFETMAMMVNNVLRHIPKKEFFVRTYEGNVRAFLSDKYAPIDNRFYMETLQEIVPDSRLSHWRGDVDTIYGNILLPNSIIEYPEDDTDFGGMVSIGNCEIGKRPITQRPSIFRSICMNGCIWGQVQGSQIKRRHIGNIDLTELAAEIRENIETQLPLIPEGIRKLKDTQSLIVKGANMMQVIAGIAVDNAMSRKEATEVVNQWVTNEKHHKSLYGVLNAVTRAGQELGNESWVKFDTIAGTYLTADQESWGRFTKRVSSFTDADMKKVFAV